ncbi:hypothetical protein P4C99_08055 [Pontiellaceae bacterium B1224]|nr:hypothetical protein [Pontiellaceae bacterium B1224]
MRIAVLALYFGNLPRFAQLFLASCDKNREIDFLLVGDAWHGLENDVPENCHVRDIDLEEFKALSEKYTGIKPAFSSPYKICDYKPALGEIFQDMLEGYDYWGFCDIDIILGDISAFIPDLNKYDVFSTSKEYLSGPLFFMRNTEKINELYRKSKDYELVLASDRHFSFTECALAWGALFSGKSLLEIDTEIESMTEVIIKSEQAGNITAHFSTLSLEPERSFSGKVMIVNGKVLMNENNYIHYHHLHNKGRSIYTFPSWGWRKVPNEYYINKFGVYSGIGLQDVTYRLSQFLQKWERRLKKRLMKRGTSGDGNETKIT